MLVQPTISAPREDARLSDVEIFRLRHLPSAEYLLTPWWRRRRDRALRRAAFRCSRCETKRELQVHHRTYATVGNEADADLDVLCRSCHEGHRVDESRRQDLGVYIKLVSETLRLGRFTAMVDLIEAVKLACAKERIPYDSGHVYEAVARVEANRAGVIDAPTHRAWSSRAHVGDPRPITRTEAADILTRLGIIVAFREIKPAVWYDPNESARQVAEATQRAAEMGMTL